MPLATKFPTRADIVSERVIDFMAHLRSHGLRLGVSETRLALETLSQINMTNAEEVKLALKSVCASDADQYAKFDDLFRSFWFNHTRKTERHETSEKPANKSHWSNLSQHDDGLQSSGVGQQDLPDDNNGEDQEAAHSGEGKLIASEVYNINKADLREFMKPEDQERANKVAESLARAIRDHRSRRRRSAIKGALLDLRKIARKSISTGGVPFKLAKRITPDRPVHLVAILDVSGSMTVYSRIFLSFLKGLVSADQRTDAYLFHTQLVKISDALRDPDSFRSINQLSMMAQGFGGGTKIGKNIETFNNQYAAQSVSSRSVVIILSDGYDTDPPEVLSHALARLKKKGCKLIWLNPLKGWKDYQPIAAGMAAALPHLDLFAPATTLNDLAALEPHLGRI
ncbi:MAG: VWA domain-containing protein [Rhizobiaceae bacterium]|nr:VWA domain-containing protein [Rhizobiaceae bacterium]